MAGGARGGIWHVWRVWRRGASGFRRSRLLRKRMLRLASRGFGNREIAFAPCRFGVHALSLRPRPSFPETGRTSTGIGRARPFRALVPVIGARARSAAGRLACVCGADAARCCRLAPPRPAAPRLRAAAIARHLRNHGAEKFYPWRQEPTLMAGTNREELLLIEFSSRLGDRVDAAVLRQGGGTPPQGRRKR